MHLICGECGALLLDTGYGIGNLKSVIEQLTDKPVSVFNTHWHGDHTAETANLRMSICTNSIFPIGRNP